MHSHINVIMVLLCEQFVLPVVFIYHNVSICIKLACYRFGVYVMSVIFGGSCSIYS